MTVETTINRTAYIGNGLTTTFAVPFKFLEPEHLVVVLTTAGVDAPQTLDDDYAVTGAGAAGADRRTGAQCPRNPHLAAASTARPGTGRRPPGRYLRRVRSPGCPPAAELAA